MKRRAHNSAHMSGKLPQAFHARAAQAELALAALKTRVLSLKAAAGS